MSDASSQKDHLLNLARDAEREASRLFSEEEYHDAERYQKLAAIYLDMAKETVG